MQMQDDCCPSRAPESTRDIRVTAVDCCGGAAFACEGSYIDVCDGLTNQSRPHPSSLEQSSNTPLLTPILSVQSSIAPRLSTTTLAMSAKRRANQSSNQLIRTIVLLL